MAHGFQMMMTKPECVAALTAEIRAGRRILYFLNQARAVEAVANLPGPFVIHVDDGNDSYPVVGSGCDCAASVLTILAISGQAAAVMVSVPKSTVLDQFLLDMKVRVGEDQPVMEETHRYVNLGMLDDGDLAIPVVLVDAIKVADPEFLAELLLHDPEVVGS